MLRGQDKMGTIVGGIGTSHVPSIGKAYDMGQQADPDWKPLFDAYKPVQKWLQELSKSKNKI